MELERRYVELDIDGDGNVQDPEGRSLHTYLVHHFHLPATQFPELDPDLDAPRDAEVWSTDVELFRKTSPIMGADIITTWLAGMSVYQDPVHSKACRQGYARIHARTPLPIRFVHVGHPCFEIFTVDVVFTVDGIAIAEDDAEHEVHSTRSRRVANCSVIGVPMAVSNAPRSAIP